MLPASNRGTGTNTGFPDVCNTPVGAGSSPVPYTNVASASSASTFSSIVYIGMVNALNLVSTIPSTSGDEAGSAGPCMGSASYTTGNAVVFVEKVPAINLACPTSGNNHVCSTAAVVVPATSVVTFSQRDLSPEAVASATRGAVTVRVGAESLVEVALSRITTDVGRDLATALAKLGVETLRAVRFDLRGCPGGDLEGALDLASRFSRRGALLCVVEDEDGDREPRRSTGGPWEGAAVEVVVDRGTASAAEALTVALRAGAGARVRGERTYGKGRLEAARGGAFVRVGEVLDAHLGRIEGAGVAPEDAS